MKTYIAVFTVGFALANALMLSPAWAQPLNRIDGVPVGLGDSVAEVKAELHTDIDPEEMETASPSKKGTTYIHLKTKGVWAFFDKDGKVETIRLDAPFDIPVDGVRIGDKLASVKSMLGEPIKKPFSFGSSMSYLYVLNDVVTLRVDIDEDNEVETMFLFK